VPDLELVARAAIIYFGLILLMRLAGNRQFAQMTAFDLVLLLLIAEVTDQALIGEDRSVTGVLVVITTLIALDILMSLAKRRWRPLGKLLEGVPMLLVDHGKLVSATSFRERVSPDEILEAARRDHGIESMDGIEYAILERNGNITIVPKA